MPSYFGEGYRKTFKALMGWPISTNKNRPHLHTEATAVNSPRMEVKAAATVMKKDFRGLKKLRETTAAIYHIIKHGKSVIDLGETYLIYFFTLETSQSQ